MTHHEIFSEKNSLDENMLKEFCDKANLQYNLIDLDNLVNVKSRFSFIFTGNEKNNINKGHDHHWIFLDGKNIFDSYGVKNSYQLPSNFEILTNHPRQLQEYNSTVCGEYCCAFYYFIAKNKELSPQEIGEEFSDYFGFTKDKLENDKIVFNWFKQFTNEENK